MRSCLLTLFLFTAVLVPTVGNAQVSWHPSAPPQVTAASSTWQINGEPVFYAGDYYFPAGPTVFFDGNVMVGVGTFRAVPLYVDSTMQPYRTVFVPVGGKLMRPYERRRSDELAGAEGSRALSLPVQLDAQTPPFRVDGEDAVVPAPSRPVGTTGTVVPSSARPRSPAPVERRSTRAGAISVPSPRSNAGVWIEYSGARWYNAGPAVTLSTDRFASIGQYHGLPVYRDRTGHADFIYIPAVQDGPLVPYRR